MIDIKDKADCDGCGACSEKCPSHCICMTEDDKGFIYPKTDQKNCINCGLCNKVCPISSHKTSADNHIGKAYASYNKDGEKRKTASSGGIFQALAEYVIKRNGCVFGVKFDHEWNTCHECASNEEEIEPLKRSKYIQSRTNGTFFKAKETLESGRIVLYTGTPCQIAGLKAYLGKEYDNLICMDFICHGVASPKIWQKYIEEKRYGLARHYHIKDKSKIVLKSVNFRDKRISWRMFNLTMTFCINGKDFVETTSPVWEDDYMQAFLKDYANRPSCFNCKFRSGRSGSDLTIGDFWGIEDIITDKDLTGEGGTSLIIPHNERTNNLIRELDCALKEMSLEDSIKGNRAYIQDWSKPKTHDYFFQKIKSNTIRHALEKAERKNFLLQKYELKSTKNLKYRLKYRILNFLYGKTQQ